MAEVIHDPKLQERAEAFLTYLTREWRAVPAIAGEWDEWDDYARLVFVLEWPIREDRLKQLQQYAEQGVLTPAQQDRYTVLLELVARYRPIVQELLAE
jgi:hypothetical protein